MSKLSMFFPGGNTCTGFHSFYDYVAGPDAARLFIIKGGPGVGKSTFLKTLGVEFLSLGHDVEYHWCSSDNDSLDGIVICDVKIALIDGTAPHVIDPRCPGAIDEIINLGEYWNEDELRCKRQDIVDAGQLVSKYFRLAYQRLKEARCIWDELCELYGGPSDDNLWRDVFQKIINSIKPAAVQRPSSAGRNRHLFASSITPGGVITYLDSLIDDDFKAIALRGLPGSGVHKVLAALENWAVCEGIPVEVYHNCFDPAWLDVLIFRKIKLLVLDASGLLVNYEPVLSRISDGMIFDLDPILSTDTLIRMGNHIQDANERFDYALKGAVQYLALAKRNHDEIEEYYIPAMDFKLVNQKRDEIRDRILTYLKQG